MQTTTTSRRSPASTLRKQVSAMSLAEQLSTRTALRKRLHAAGVKSDPVDVRLFRELTRSLYGVSSLAEFSPGALMKVRKFFEMSAAATGTLFDTAKSVFDEELEVAKLGF